MKITTITVYQDSIIICSNRFSPHFDSDCTWLLNCTRYLVFNVSSSLFHKHHLWETAKPDLLHLVDIMQCVIQGGMGDRGDRI